MFFLPLADGGSYELPDIFFFAISLKVNNELEGVEI